MKTPYSQAPAEWKHTRIKYISSLKGRLGWQGLKADEYVDDGPFVVSSAHFEAYKIRWDICPHVSPERYAMDANIQLCANDNLLMKDGAALGKLAYVESLPGPACLNSHLLLFRPMNNAYWPRFLFYILDSQPFQEYAAVYGTGATFLGVSQESVSDYRLSLPPIEEQHAIADYLDRKTAAIDALIEKKERLIALLAEKRAALINQAVTKGLNPDAPMKDSGVPWIGEIPAHWVTARLSFRYEQQLGKMLSPLATDGPNQAPYLANKDVQWDMVRIDDLSTMSFSAAE